MKEEISTGLHDEQDLISRSIDPVILSQVIILILVFLVSFVVNSDCDDRIGYFRGTPEIAFPFVSKIWK